MNDRVRVKLYGFEQVRQFIDNLKNDIYQIMVEPMMQVGLKGEAIAKQHLRDQDLNWKPLSPTYLKWKTTKRKGKRRMSEKTLIATSSYFQSITTWADLKKAYIGVKRGVNNEEGQEIANIAKIHEYGSTKRNIPARPLWQPTLEELKSYVVAERPFVKAFMIYLRRKYTRRARP